MLNPTILIESLSDSEMRFRLRNVSTAYANALRRIMIAEVPTMAIEFVTIYENTSPLHDEFVSHRLGMLPLYSTAADSFNYPSECTCVETSEVCHLCSVKFSLSVKNEKDEILEVTTADLVQEQITNDAQRSVKPVKYKLQLSGETKERDVLIMKLGKKQELRFDCVVKKGIGKQHAKWSPVCVASMKYEPRVSITEVKALELTPQQKVDFVNCCPTKVFGLNPKSNNVEVQNSMNCIFCYECIKKQKDFDIEDIVKVEDGDFIFDIETTGCLKPDEVLDSAFEQLNLKLTVVKEALGSINISAR